MSLTTSLVDINNIHTTQARSLFSESALETLANLMLQTGGIIQPLIVKKTGLEQYEVIEGHFEYYAAVKAQEIDDDFEMIRAFIISDEKENFIQKQIDLLRNKPAATSKILPGNLNKLEVRLNNLEVRLNNIVQDLQQQQNHNQEQLETKINQIKSSIGKKLDPLDTFNKLSIDKLAIALRSSGMNSKEAVKIAESIEKERSKQLFISLLNVVERVKKIQGKRKIKAISHARMLEIIDAWSKISFDF